MIKYNNIVLDNLQYIKITNVKNNVLPNIKVNSIEVPGMPGAVGFENDIGIREIEIEYLVKGNNDSEIIQRNKEFINSLYSKDNQKLYLKAGEFYNSVLTQGSELQIELNVAMASIKFTCNDPFCYSDQIFEGNVSVNNTTGLLSLNNDGYEYPPNFTIDFLKNTQELTILNESNDEYFSIGEYEDFDKESYVENPYLYSEGLGSLNGLTTPSMIPLSTIAGEFETNGYSITPENYGERTAATGWQGPAVEIPIDKIQDFKMKTVMGLMSNNVKQIGRIGIYLLDEGGNRLGSFTFTDSSKTAHNPIAKGYVEGIERFTTAKAAKGYYKNLNTCIEIKREGKKWSFAFGKLDDNQNFSKMMRGSFTHNKTGNKLARISIFIGAYNNEPAINFPYVSWVRVQEITPKQVDKAPIIFKKGDTLFVDCEKGRVLKNGQRYYQYVDPFSTFPMIKRGVNNFLFSNPANITVKMKYRKRWL